MVAAFRPVHRRAIPYPTGKRHTGIDTAVRPDLFFYRSVLPGHRLPSTRQLAMQTGLHRNTISKVCRQLETDGVVEAMAGSEYCAPTSGKSRHHRIRNQGVTDLDREVRKCVDGLLNAGCTLQQTRELLTREIDWRLRCGARVLSAPPGRHRRLNADC